MNSNDTSITYRTSHDLRGPLINIQGFAGEVNSAVEKLCELFDKHEAELPSEFRIAVANLVNEDLNPCMEYLDSAIALLEDRIGRMRSKDNGSETGDQCSQPQ